MSESKAVSAVMSKLKDVLGPVPLAVENQRFPELPSNGLWAAAFYLPASCRPVTLGQGGYDRLEAITQLDLNAPLQSGTFELRELADEVRGHFTAGTSLTYNGQEVRIRSCETSPGREVDNCYRVSLSIGWYSHINR